MRRDDEVVPSRIWRSRSSSVGEMRSQPSGGRFRDVLTLGMAVVQGYRYTRKSEQASERWGTPATTAADATRARAREKEERTAAIDRVRLPVLVPRHLAAIAITTDLWREKGVYCMNRSVWRSALQCCVHNGGGVVVVVVVVVVVGCLAKEHSIRDARRTRSPLARAWSTPPSRSCRAAHRFSRTSLSTPLGSWGS